MSDTKAFPWLNPQQVGKPAVEFRMEDDQPCSFSVGQRHAKTFPCLDPQKVEQPSLDIMIDDDSPARSPSEPSLDIMIEDDPHARTFASACVVDQAVEETMCRGVAARRLFFEGCESLPNTSSSISWSTRCPGEDAGLLLDVSRRDGDVVCRDLPVAAEMQTGEIKYLIAESARIDVEDQCLFYRGAEMHDEDFPLLGLSREQRVEFHLRQRPRNISLPDGSWFCGSVRKHVSSSSSVPLRIIERGTEYIFHGLGTMRTTSGDCYSGQWRKHQRDGEGRVDYANGDFCQGTFRDNQRCGRGRYETAGGDVYRGEFVLDKMSGDGELRRATGEVYTGQFLEGRYHGVGRQACPDGGLYTGQFVSGNAHGECVNQLVDGSIYQGQFCNGHFDGDGTMSYADGHEYFGHFIGGMMDGEGVYRSPNKNIIYEGQFVEDESHGRGRYFSPNGFMYEGEFCSDMFHGHGALHHADGRIEEGCFEDGDLVSRVVQEVCARGGA